MMKWKQAGTYTVIKENLVGILTHHPHQAIILLGSNCIFANLRDKTAFALDFDFSVYFWSTLYCSYYSVLPLDQVRWSRLFCPAMDLQESLHFDKGNVQKT